MSIAPWPQLEGVLNELWRKHQPAGSNYAWFIAVALQRIHGLRWDDIRQRRAELKLVRERSNPQPVENQRLDTRQMITDLAAKKAMR